MQDENFFTRNFGAATPLAAPSLAKTPAPESDGTQGFSLADRVNGDLVFEPDDELVEKCANLNMQGKRYEHLAPLYFNAESKAVLSKKVEARTREKHRQDFDSLVKFAKNIRNFGTGEIYDDGTFKGEGVDANTAKSLGDSTARLFIRLFTDDDFEKATGFKNTEDLGRAASRVILYCTETDAEASARYERASDESVYRELDMMQSASGTPERMRISPESKEEAVGALAKIRKTGASRFDAALQIAGSEVALKKAFALSLMNEGGAERFLRGLSEKDPAEADRIFRAAMLISPAEEGGFIQAGKNLLWMGKNGLYHGLVDLVSAVRAGKDSTQEDAFYAANRWLQENKLGGVMTEDTLNALDEEQKKSLYEFVSKTVKAVDSDKMKPETTIGAPGWEAASLFRTLSFPKKAYSPESLDALIREGMKIFAEKYGETKAEELASPKLHDDQWAQSLANEAAFSLAYMTPSLVAASAGGAPGFAIAMGLQGFGESYNERYSEGDVTSTAGERAVSAALYGAFMGTTNAFLYSSFANGGKWVWNKIAGTSVGAKIGSIIPGSALTRFATRSITDSDELFLARYGNSVAQRTCALLGRHLVRQSSLMLEEGSTEALEEAFKRFANESILESKTYDGSDVDRGNLVEALWESFKVGALIAPGIHMAMSPGSVSSTASLYTKKRSDLGSGEGDDASTVMRAKSERLWAFVGSSEAASQRKTAISGSGEDYSNYVKFATAFRNFLEKGEKPKEYDSLSEEQRRFFDRASEYWKNTDERGKNAILSGVFFGNVSSRNGRYFTAEELRNAMVIMTDELIRTHLEFNIRESEETLRTLETERDRRALPGAVLGQEEESKSKNELLWISTKQLSLEIEKAKASIEELKRLKEEKENNIRKARDSFGTFGLSEEDVEAASEAVGSKVDESAKETIRTWIQESYDKAKAMGDERGVKSAEIYARANGIKIEERAAETKTETETDTKTETETAEAPVVEETPEKAADEAFANGKDDAERVRIAVQSGHFVDEEAAKKAVEEAKSRKEEADKRKAVIDELRGKMKALEKLLGEDFDKLYGASAEQLEILSAVASAAKRMKLVESLRAAIRFMSESNWNVEPNIAKGQKGDSFMKAVSVLLSAGKAKNARAFARNIRAIERLYKSGKLRKGSEDSESIVVLAANLALANDSASAGTKSVIKQIKSVGEINDIFEDVGKSVADATSIDNDPFGVYGEYADEVGEKHKFPSQYPSFRELIDRVAKKRGVPKEQVYDEAQDKLVKALRSGNFSGRNAFAGSVVQDAPLKPNEWRARTPSAENSVVVSGEYRVVDADELTFVDVSDKAQQNEQERNREGTRTQLQTFGMHDDFVSDRLLEDAHTDRGAPIYRELEDGKLRSVSGEARSRLIKRVYKHGGAPEAQYRAALEKFARERGIEIPAGIKKPVLVRVVKDAGGLSWDKLAKASNMDMKASYTAAERSHADARELQKIVGLLNATESGDIMNAANDAFLSAFNEAVQAGTTYIQDAKEGFNEQLGKRALEALVAYVINDREVATRLLDSPISLGHIYDAIYDVAPTLVRMRANERYDLSREISSAIKAAIYAKTQRENGNPNGPAGIIETYFSDNTFEGIEENPRTGIDLGATKMLAKLMVEYGNRYKLKRVLKDYAESVRSKNGIEGENMSLFGETEWGTKADLIKEAVDKNAGSTAKLSVEEGTGSPLVKFRRISRNDQQRLASLLGEWLPGIKVRVVDSIAEATGDANAKMMRERGAEEPFGAYDPEKNEVIVRKHARVDTLMHELAWHATFEFARRASEKLKDGKWNTDETLSKLGEDKVKSVADIYAKMREFAASAPESLKKSLREAYEKQVGALDEEALLDEYGARLFTELYTGKIEDVLKTKVSRSWIQDLANLVSKAWKLLCEALSGKGVNLERIAKMDASDAMNALADAFARGKRFVDEGKANKNVSIETTEDDPAKDLAAMQEAFFRRLDAFARANPQMRFSKSWRDNRYSLARDDGNADADYLEPSDFGEDGRVKPEILAEIEAEKAKIREDAQKNGSFMKSPNGAPSKLNAEQWVLVRTKRFKRWFGDWENNPKKSSKVVDENGEPMVVYHGTWDKFNEFSREKLGGFLEIETTPARSFIGFWFSENPMSGFDDYMECFINLRSPKEYESLGGLDYDLESSGEDNISNRRNIGHEYRNTSIRDGNDGVIINYDLETRGYSFVAFFPEQIKSATENVGTYSRENPDIRYSLAMETSAEYLEPSDFGEDGRVKPEILAEIEAEKAKIREDAQKNGSFMKAPNGAPSKLNAEQWVLVRTKRFKRWFGGWEAEGNEDVSKVVDENGEPLVVYHGTGEKFYEFSHKFGMRNGASLGRGFYFTEDEDYARGYGNEIMGVFLNIRNPLEPGRNKISKEDLKRVIRRIDPNGDTVADYASSYRGYPGKEWYERSLDEAVNAIFSVSNNYVETSDSDILGELFSVWGGEGALRAVSDVLGYDGFIPKRTLSDDVKIAFFPEQIKSATENVGTYSRENPDIRYSLAMEEDPFESLDEDVREAARKLTNHEQLKQLWEDAFGWWANKVLDAAGIARDSEEGVKIREFYSWETAYAQILKEYRDGDAINAANERMRRRAERKSGVSMSKRVSGAMNRYGIRAFDGSADWARNAWKAIVEADGDSEEALEILKGIIMPHYHRLAVRSLSAAKAIEAESLVDRIDDVNTAESALKIAEKLEKTLAEASDSQALEALRENTKRLLQKYGSGAFRRTTDLANRKFYGGAEKLLSDLYKYSKLRNKDAWRQIFEKRQAELINEIESQETSEQKRVEDVAELQALGYWWAKPLKDMSAAELIALGDRIAETAVQGVTALDKAIEARKAGAESAWSDVRTAVREGVAKRGDRSQKSHILRAISTIGYSLQARLESAIRYAGEGYQKAIDSIRSLDRRITEANNIAAAKVERDEHAFFSAILRYAGEKNRIVPDSKSKGYGAMSRAAENELVKLCLFAEGGERFSKRGEKLTWLELMAQYLMMNQKEWADMFAGLKPSDVPEGSREAYDRWARNAELAEFLGEDKVRLAEETSAILQAHAAAIDAEAVKITGTTLSYSRGSGYFPIVHNIDEYMANVTPNVSGGVPSVVPKILIPRQHSRKDIDEHADLFSIFRRHVYDVSLFEAQGETGVGSDLREFLGEDWKGVREDVAKIIGNRNANDIWKQMAQTLNGKSMGSYEDTASGRIVSASARVMRFFARMLGLGFNIVSTAKQAFGSFPSYMLEYGATNTLKALLKNPLAAIDFAQELIDSDGYAQRYGNTAADRAMGVISRVRSLGVNTPKAFQLVARFENLALIGTSYGDRLPMFAVGAPIYATMVDKYLRDGNTVEDAKRLAMADFWAMTDKTQQARQIHNQDLISSGANDFNKMFVQFLTSPIQFASIELHAAEMFIAHPSKENFDKLVNSVIHNHLIQPLIMALIVYYVRGIADDDEEDFIAKLEIKDFAMGSFASMPYFGSIAEYYLFSDYSHGYGATAAMSPAGADVTFKLIERSAKLAKSVFDEKDGSTEKAARKLAETSAAIRYAMQIYDKYEED